MQFKLRDIFVLMIGLAILLGLLLPAVNAAREAARVMQCSNNLKLIALAIHNYESTYRKMTCAMGGTDGPPLISNAGSLSGFVSLICYMEASPWNSQLMSATPPGGPAPWVTTTSFDLWSRRMPFFECPSDPPQSGTAKPKLAYSNYAFCWGDGVASILDVPDMPPTRGPFQAKVYKRFPDVRDGLANTVGGGEIARGASSAKHGKAAVVAGIERSPATCLAQFASGRFVKNTLFVQSPEGRGGRWCDGRPYYTGFTTVLPPNALSCSPTDDDGIWGIFTASSPHRGIVQVFMLDGSVRAISNNIDCGLLNNVPPDSAQRNGEKLASPYGVWGAMGTIASEGDLLSEP